MATWAEFAAARPDMATAAHELLYQFGVGLAFLATVSKEGDPRVHPICPLLVEGDLRAFIVASPKRGDLTRHGRYALHSFPCPDNEDAVYLVGRAEVVTDDAAVASSSAQFIAERSAFPVDLDGQILFSLGVDRCMITRTTGHGDPSPQHTLWTASAA